MEQIKYPKGNKNELIIVKGARENNLKVILCVGEYLEQREQGVTAELVSMQTKIALNGISEEEMKQVIMFLFQKYWKI